MVTTTADTGAGSLRKAITETWNYDTIGISLPGTDTIALKSAIEITKRITILGKNQRTGNRTVIQVDTPRVSPYRVFTLSACGRYPASDTCVLIKNVVLRGGRVWPHGGGVIAGYERLILDSVVVSDGVVAWGGYGDLYAQGGGIYWYRGELTIANSTIANNASISAPTRLYLGKSDAGANGGGIYCYEARVLLVNSTIANNACSASVAFDSASRARAVAVGGGIYAYEGTLTCINSSIAGNALYAVNYLCSENFADIEANGAGVYSHKCHMAYVHTTIANNLGSVWDSTVSPSTLAMEARGEGIYCYEPTCAFLNSIVVNNSAITNGRPEPNDFYGYYPENRARASIIGVSHNLTMTDCLTELTTQRIFGTSSPALADNGGPTYTISLGSLSSPAVGAGDTAGLFPGATRVVIQSDTAWDTVSYAAYHDSAGWYDIVTDSALSPSTVITPVTTDQRGVARAASPCIGAFEYTPEDAGTERATRTGLSFRALTPLRNTLRFHSPVRAAGRYEIVDMNGRLIHARPFVVTVGVNALVLPRVSSGATVCRVLVGGYELTQTLVFSR